MPPARPFSLRIDPDTLQRLDDRARAMGEPRSRVVKRCVEDGLRMDAHPGIVFRGGPAGRRAALAAGPDVWEVIKAVKSLGGGEEGMAKAAEWLSLSSAQIRAVVQYYADYRDEIDDWIKRAEEEADRAESAWRRSRDAVA